MLEIEFKNRLLDHLPETALVPFVLHKAIARDKEWLDAILSWDFLGIRDVEMATDESDFLDHLKQWEKRVAAVTGFVQGDVLSKTDGTPLGDANPDSTRLIAHFKASTAERDEYLNLLSDIHQKVIRIQSHRCFATLDPDLDALTGTFVNLSTACCALDFGSLLTSLLKTCPKVIDTMIEQYKTESLLFEHVNDHEPVCLQMFAFQFSSLSCYKAIKDAWKGPGAVPFKLAFIGDALEATPVSLLDNMLGNHFPIYCKSDVFLEMLEMERDAHENFDAVVAQIFSNTETRTDLADCVDHMLDQQFFDSAPLLYLTAAVEWGHAEAVKRIAIEKNVLEQVLKTDNNPSLKVLKFICNAQQRGMEDLLASGKFEKSLIAFNKKLSGMNLEDKIFDSFPKRRAGFPEPLRSMLISGRQSIVLSALEMGLEPQTPIRDGMPSPLDYAKSLQTPHADKAVEVMTSWSARSLAHDIIAGMDFFRGKHPAMAS